ncbi:MAG: FG-GAP repeat domain-containing protein [Planctomycetota bacterium]
MTALLLFLSPVLLAFQETAAAPVSPAPGAPLVTPIRFETVPNHLALVDLDGDGTREMVQVRGAQLTVEMPDETIQEGVIPGSATLWTIADLEGNGEEAFLALVDGKELRRCRLLEGECRWNDILLQNVGATIPRGVQPARFARDLDGDGRIDLLVPFGDKVRIFFRTGQGFRQGPDLGVVSRLELQLGMPGQRMLARARRLLSVPAIEMRDISGDGRPDLLISQGQEIRQFVSDEQGLPARPTVTVELKKWADKLPEIRFDPSNLGSLTRTKLWVFEEWADLDQDGALDLILLWGGKVLIYMGGPSGVRLSRPHDQVSASGNILYALAIPVDSDPYPDLVLVRVENISLARALTALVFSFSLKVDILAYKGLGNGRFSKRPMPETKKLEIDSPSLLKLGGQKEEADALRRTVVRIGDLDGDGRPTDLIVLDEKGGLSAWSGVIPDRRVLDEASHLFLRELLKKNKVVELDLATLAGWLFGRPTLLLSKTRGRTPLFQLPPPADWFVPQAMTVSDLDGDGRDEILMFRRTWRVQEDSRRHLVGFLVDPDGRAPPPAPGEGGR